MSKAADVFSFGVILWELLTCKRAWANASFGQVIFIITVKGDTLKPPPDAPPLYASIMEACMAKEKDDRPTFAEMLPKLEALLNELPSPSEAPEPLTSDGGSAAPGEAQAEELSVDIQKDA